jgi:hypothetical protein
MSATLLDLPSRLLPQPGSVAGTVDKPPELRRPGGGRVTLEERLESAWRGLHGVGAAECPLCGGRMTLRPGAGECGECGGRLS